MSINFFSFEPAVINIITSVVAAASAVAAFTPNKHDDAAMTFVRKVVDFLAFNWGNAANAKRR